MAPSSGGLPSASAGATRAATIPIVRAAIAKALRAGQYAGLAALALAFGSQGLQTASANGDTRTITFHHQHTGESLTITYKRDGRYDPEALQKINWELRDWRRGEAVKMDPEVIDAVWDLYRAVDGKDGVEVICGYRAPATNSMLRARSSGVAEHSQHMLGKAIDLKIRNVPLDVQRAAALRLQRGGVGYYPGSQFIHVDVASVRHWPRMTRDQLVRVFPDGRTVHVPSDGKPLQGYQQALADLQRRGASPSLASLEAARASGVDTLTAKPARNLLAALFGGARDPEEDADNAAAAAPPARPAAKPAAKPEPKVAAKPDAKPEIKPEPKPEARRVAAAPAPAPVAKPTRPSVPAETVTLASASSTPVQLADEPPRPPADIAEAAETPIQTASLGEITISPWSRRDAADRVPLELALAYAAEPTRTGAAGAGSPAPGTPATKAPAMGSLVDRARLAADGAPHSADPSPVTVVKKGNARLPSGEAERTAAAAQPAVRTEVVAVAPGMRFDDPWLRAVMLAPSLHTGMTVSGYADPDWREVSSLMSKPAGSVMMTFASDPYPGMSSERFGGGAVVFLATVTFQRTAMR